MESERMSVEDLQKALEELFSDFLSTKLTYPQFDEKFKKLFSVFQKTRETVDLKGLEQKAKTFDDVFRQDYLNPDRNSKRKWVSLEDATSLLAQVFSEKIEKLQKELNEANLLCELQASRISGLETFKKQCDGKVLVDRKQLSESLDRLAEDCHDKIIDELKFPAHHRHSGWAKVLQPIIWGWYEKLIHGTKKGSGD